VALSAAAVSCEDIWVPLLAAAVEDIQLVLLTFSGGCENMFCYQF